jgi:poly-beta-1,6-N-acetyl-D-glucosamine synthase
MILEVVSGLLGLAYIGILSWYAYGWRKAGALQVSGEASGESRLKVSVIVPARNEAGNIEKCLDSLLGQKAPRVDLEVIVVDDASEDNTAGIVRSYMERDARIRLISLGNQHQQSHKKRAVEAGIAAASGILIACTDADCTHHPKWIDTLASAYDDGRKKFVAAPVVYHTVPTLVSVFQTLDFMTLQGITAASVATRFHTMCNGANIAYEKAVFYEVKGFEGIDHLPTGDDMLLMHKIFCKYPDGIAYVRSQEAIVTTDAAPDWSAFFQQRIRWASKAAYYDDKRIFWVLVLVYFFNGWFAVLLIIGFWQTEAWLSGVVLLTVKTIAELAFLGPVASFFQKGKWLLWFPFLEPLHIAYTISAGWLGRFGTYQWKGRSISKPADLKDKSQG